MSIHRSSFVVQRRLPERSHFVEHATCGSLGAGETGAINFLLIIHQVLMIEGTQVLIRDRGSMYGTYVNGIRIQQQTLLESGDIIVCSHVSTGSFLVLIHACQTLGQQISRSSAPQNTSDSQLNPIEASITIVGA